MKQNGTGGSWMGRLDVLYSGQLVRKFINHFWYFQEFNLQMAKDVLMIWCFCSAVKIWDEDRSLEKIILTSGTVQVDSM